MASKNSMSNAHAAKANTYVLEAEKALNKRGFSSFFAPKQEKFETAADLYNQAGNSYKMAKMWLEAGQAYMNAAKNKMECDSGTFEAGNMYKEAGNCLVKASPVEAVKAWEKGVECFSERGNWNTCGNLQKSIAEVYEQQEKDGGAELQSDTTAMDMYQMAADFFENDGRQQPANTCKEKIGLMAGEKGEYARAAECFDMLAKSAMEKKLTSFGAKAHMIKCIVMVLATEDVVQARAKLQEFTTLDYTLDGTRELTFMTALVDAVETQSAQEFKDACGEFNGFKKLDPWLTRMLLVSKRRLGELDGEEGEGEEGAGEEPEEDLNGPVEEEDLT